MTTQKGNRAGAGSLLVETGFRNPSRTEVQTGRKASAYKS